MSELEAKKLEEDQKKKEAELSADRAAEAPGLDAQKPGICMLQS